MTCELSVACVHVANGTAPPNYLRESEMYVCTECIERLIRENFPKYLLRDYVTICIDCMFAKAKEMKE